MTAAGALRWRVLIERPISTEHDQAEGIVRWQTVRSTFLQALDPEPPAPGRRTLWSFLVRSGAHDVGWRLRRGARFFMIVAVARDWSPGFDRLLCEEWQ